MCSLLNGRHIAVFIFHCFFVKDDITYWFKQKKHTHINAFLFSFLVSHCFVSIVMKQPYIFDIDWSCRCLQQTQYWHHSRSAGRKGLAIMFQVSHSLLYVYNKSEVNISDVYSAPETSVEHFRAAVQVCKQLEGFIFPNKLQSVVLLKLVHDICRTDGFYPIIHQACSCFFFPSYFLSPVFNPFNSVIYLLFSEYSVSRVTEYRHHQHTRTSRNSFNNYKQVLIVSNYFTKCLKAPSVTRVGNFRSCWNWKTLSYWAMMVMKAWDRWLKWCSFVTWQIWPDQNQNGFVDESIWMYA